MSDRLQQQLALVVELDQLKSVLRKSKIQSAGNRAENSAEHSWHVALVALLLQEYANEQVDISKVVKMLLIHDVVEIDAGDIIVYDVKAREANYDNEVAAAKRLFGMLPEAQGNELLDLWLEFEHHTSPEARFAKALDRLIPMLLNYHNQGQSWIENQVHKEQVLDINKSIEHGSQTLWNYAKTIIDEAHQHGWLK